MAESHTSKPKGRTERCCLSLCFSAVPSSFPFFFSIPFRFFNVLLSGQYSHEDDNTSGGAGGTRTIKQTIDLMVKQWKCFFFARVSTFEGMFSNSNVSTLLSNSIIFNCSRRLMFWWRVHGY